jgi:biopolymer transport protein ExbB
MRRIGKRAWTIALLASIALLFAGTSCAMAQQQPATSPDSGIVGPAGRPASEEAASTTSSPEAAPSARSASSPVGSDVAGRVDLPHDLSAWGMFMSADWVVKAVMIGLAFASLVTWTVCLAKSIEVACARARARRAIQLVAWADSLAEADRSLANRGGPAAFMVRSATEELRRSLAALDHAGDVGVTERVASRLARIEAQAGRRLMRGTGLLATIGATAPFIGLFGTVWGIMNAFIGISQTQTTNLAVVAPGIAEALLTTAAGLVAAVPAVIVYNVFARAIAGYRLSLGDAAAEVKRLVSRDLDFRKVPGVRKRIVPDLAAE